MPIDKKEIKKAIDHFENDKFTDAKEILSKEIKVARSEFLKNKLGLKNELCEETAYQKFFNKMLKDFGVDSPEDLDDKKKKEFFNKVDKEWKGKNEED